MLWSRVQGTLHGRTILLPEPNLCLVVYQFRTRWCNQEAVVRQMIFWCRVAEGAEDFSGVIMWAPPLHLCFIDEARVTSRGLNSIIWRPRRALLHPSPFHLLLPQCQHALTLEPKCCLSSSSTSYDWPFLQLQAGLWRLNDGPCLRFPWPWGALWLPIPRILCSRLQLGKMWLSSPVDLHHLPAQQT